MLSPSISVSTSYGYDFLNDFIEEISMDSPSQMKYTFDASTGKDYKLPDDFVSLHKIWDEAADAEYTGTYTIRQGRIEIHNKGEYTLVYNRPRGPLRHYSDDTAYRISSTECKTQAQAVELLEEVISDYNLHIASTSLHIGDDTSYSCTASTSTSTDSTSFAVLQWGVAAYNLMKSKLESHYSFTTGHLTDDYMNYLCSTLSTCTASTASTGSTSTDLYMAVNDLARKYTEHIKSGMPPKTFDYAGACYCAYRYQIREDRTHPDVARLWNTYTKAVRKAMPTQSTPEESQYRVAW